LLKEAVKSVQNQVFENYELIIVNDFSTDDSELFLNQLALKDTRVIIIKNSSNIGLQRSLNIALDRASGKYIARIDDDDKWINPFKIMSQVKFLEDNPDYMLVGTSFRIDENVFINPLNDSEIRKQMLFRCPFQHSTVLFRAKFEGLNFKYDHKLDYSEDWDLWLLIAKFGKIRNLATVTTEIGNTNNLSSKFYLKQLPINRLLYKKYKNDYPNRKLAYFYHLGIKFYFKFIPMESFIHAIFQKVFLLVFLNDRSFLSKIISD